jgi:DNA repair ATPase RecN
MVSFFISKKTKADQILKEQHETRRQRMEQEKNNLKSIITSSENEFNKLPNFIEDSKWYLDKAEDEFSDGIFAPFWDAIESATNSLAAYHQNIDQLTKKTQDYNKRANQLIEKVPEFKLPLGKLPDARPTAERLAKIVRKAQKDFHFATIYEQRKTNQLLYQGFRSLGEAIYSIESEISSSLDGLSNKLNVSLNDLLESSREQNRIISKHNTDMDRYADNLKKLSEKESLSRRKFENESLLKQDNQDVKLDNIQRGRKPIV